mgnify:CR=1 FL=1
MKVNKRILTILIFWIGSFLPTFGQIVKVLKSNISVENQYLIAEVDNPIRIVAQQNEKVSIEQVSAKIRKNDSEIVPIEIIEEKGFFIIRPDTIGIVEIEISIGETVETQYLRVKPIEVIGRLSRYGANTDEKISSGEFKVQNGLSANVECCGFDANCQVLEFQTIRISKGNQTEKSMNKGARFDQKTKEIIMKAESRDIYIFRQIRYKCPGSEHKQRLDDMIFEIE